MLDASSFAVSFGLSSLVFPITMKKRHLVIAISGASGALYASCFLRALARLAHGSSFIIVSPAALRVYQLEHAAEKKESYSPQSYLEEVLAAIPRQELLHSFHLADYYDIGAKAASGSSPSDGSASGGE